MTTKNLRCYSIDLAMSLGEKQAMAIHQIDFWLSKPKIGYVISGRKYVRNSLNDWLAPENFPHWSLSTLRRVFDSLVSAGILLKKKIGHRWDQTIAYTLNYGNKLLVAAGYTEKSVQSEQNHVSKMNNWKCSKRTIGSVQNEQMFNIHTLPKDNNKNNLQKAVGDFSPKTDYKQDYPVATSWLATRENRFIKAVEKYADIHSHKKTVIYPQAVKMKIIVEIWKKFNGMPSNTDFTYIDHSQLKEHETEFKSSIPISHEKLLEQEMERYYEENYIRSDTQ